MGTDPIYPLVIKTDNTTGASISITQYNNLTPSILGVNEEIAALRMALRGINVTAPEEIVIDNIERFLALGDAFCRHGQCIFWIHVLPGPVLAGLQGLRMRPGCR
jgi:hypothetical protein